MLFLFLYDGPLKKLRKLHGIAFLREFLASLGILGDGHIYNKNLVFIGKNEIRQCKTFPIVNWENSFPLFFLF